MKCSVLNFSGDVVSEIELPDSIFGVPIRKDIMHQVVCWQLAKRRSGTHSTKTEGEVRGSTRKIYQQKGTGRARHGIIRAAQFRGGGVIFGPRPRSYEYKMNKKVVFLGLCSALSYKFINSSIVLVDSLNFDSYKTSDFLKFIKNYNAKSAILVDSVQNNNLRRASANVKDFLSLPIVGLNVYDILHYDKVIFSIDALNKLKDRVL